MKDLIGKERRALEYYRPKKSFGSLGRAAAMHGYRGLLGVLRYAVLKYRDHVLSRIAYFTPFNGIRILCHRLRGVTIGKNVLIGFHCVLDESFPDYITIEDNVSLAGKVYVLTHSNPYEHFRGKLKSYAAPVVIKKGAWITINVVILPGVTIGEESVITAGSVVTKTVPDGVIAGGNPAKVIKRFSEDRTAEMADKS
jgi:acetyltransferase-like isoleucine patch superfamily enzyme